MPATRLAPEHPPITRKHPARLIDEHAELLGQLTVRAAAVLAGTYAGQWPERELRDLLGYLNAEVLRQAQDEEEFLFAAAAADPELSRLARDHARLRAAVGLLERTGAGDPAPERLNTAVRDLLCQFRHHVAREDIALARLDLDALPLEKGPVHWRVQVTGAL